MEKKEINAMQRAKIDFNVFGVKDFFATIGFEKPQLIITYITIW
ncbi:hypothetical protein ES703_31074 [subsurface metagenome]